MRSIDNTFGHVCPHCQSLNLVMLSYSYSGYCCGDTIDKEIEYQCADCGSIFTLKIRDMGTRFLIKPPIESLQQRVFETDVDLRKAQKELEKTKKELEKTKKDLTTAKRDISKFKSELTFLAHTCMLIKDGMTVNERLSTCSDILNRYRNYIKED